MAAKMGPAPKLNVLDLPRLNGLAEAHHLGYGIDWELLRDIVDNGTSQGEVARALGVSQSWISRKLGRLAGRTWDDMDAFRSNRKASRRNAG